MASRLQDVLLRGTAASRPAAASVANGTLYYSTDTFIIEQSDGATWSAYSGVVSGIAVTSLTGDVTGTGPGATATTIANNAVSNAKLRDSGALSVIGRSANSSGDPADISAVAASGSVLRESGSALGFGTIATAGIANDAITYAKIQNVSATDRLLGLDSAGPADVEEIPVSSGLEFTGGPGLRVTAAVRTRQIGITVDGGGALLTTGSKGFKSFPVAGTITGWRLLANAAGNIQFDVLKSDYATFPTTASIVAAAPPALAGVQKNENTVGTWTTAVAAGDVFEFQITGTPLTITRVTLELTILVTG
jgi:Repeat of unknown function (DUF5907)